MRAGDPAATYYLLPTITSSVASCYVTEVKVVDTNTVTSDSATMDQPEYNTLKTNWYTTVPKDIDAEADY